MSARRGNRRQRHNAGRLPALARAAGLAGLGGLRGTTFVDPADPGAGFHYDGPALVARKPETVEHPRVPRGRAARLLGPAVQIIGGASGEILDRLDAVLACWRPGAETGARQSIRLAAPWEAFMAALGANQA